MYVWFKAGRFGKKGTAINFVLPKDAAFIKEIQEHYNTQIDEMPTDLDELWALWRMLLDLQITALADGNKFARWTPK